MPDPVEDISDDQDVSNDQTTDDLSDLDILEKGADDDKSATTDDSSDQKTDSSDEDDDDVDPLLDELDLDDKKKDDDESDDDADKEDDLEEELLSEEERQIDDFVRKETPEYQDIKKKYPQFFKEFPGMRHTLFRMKAMDRIFTTVDEARAVAEKHDDLLNLEAAVVQGEPDKILRGLKGIKPEAVEKFADEFLPALFKEHRETHDRITTNVLATALRVAQSQARSSGNKNLFNSVGHLSQFLFGKEVPPEVARSKQSPELEAEKQRLDNERQQMYESKARDFQTDVTGTGERLLRKELARGLDPDDVLPDFVKESIVEAAINKIGAAMDKDNAHIETMNQLWARAQRAGFSKEAKAKLVAAWYGRAKALVGPVRRRLVSQAVEKQQGKTGQTQTTRRPHIRAATTGKGKHQGFRPKSAREVDWNQTSDLDILMGKATPRKR